MTVFLAHSFGDLDAAEALAKSIERRGLFVEHEDGERVGRALQGNDAVVMLWSAVAANDPNRLLLERRALDAWADDKLILINVDRTVRPVGLRDLPSIDASEAEHWPAAWEEANAAIAQALNTPGAAAASLASAPAPAKRAKPANASLRGLGGLFLLVGLLGLIGLAVYVYQRLQYAVFDLPQIPDWGLWAGLGVVVLLFVLARALMRPSKRKTPRRKPGSAKKTGNGEADAFPQTEAVFVAYAQDDAVAVGSVVAAVEAAGRRVWINKSGVQAGQMASEIVRSVRTAHGMLVMCSPAAFQSDHVKREVYLADRYRKPLLPVYVKPAALPPDFEYFFAGVQGLDLAGTPEPERPDAIRVALAAV